MRHQRFWCLTLAVQLIFFSPCLAQEARTWTDSTGKNKLEGEFVSLQDGKVTLLGKNGKKFEIQLEKLSKADQAYAKEQSDNPFKSTEDSPFMPAKGKEKEPAAPRSSGGTMLITVDRNHAEEISAPGNTEWTYRPNDAPELTTRFKSIPMPKRADIFEKLTTMAPNLQAGKVAFGLTTGKPGGTPTTRIFLGDLTTGKANNPEPLDGEFAPLALSKDGQTLILRSNGFHFGQKSELSVCHFEGRRTIVDKRFAAYGEGHGRDVVWATFSADGTLLTASNAGLILGWDIETCQPIFQIQADGNSHPALSPDLKVLACYQKKAVILLDVKTREVVGTVQTPDSMAFAVLAFSPSGKRIACAGQQGVIIWNGENGDLQRELRFPATFVGGNLSFPDEQFLLIGNSLLLDVENEIPLWEYNGTALSWSQQGVTLLAGMGQGDSGGIYAVKLPHPEARKLLEDVNSKPELLAFRAGDPVKVDVSGIPADQQERVRTALTKQLEEIRTKVSLTAPVTVKASVEGPKQTTVSFHQSGDFPVQQYTSKVQIEYQGKTAWSSAGTNIPGMVFLKRGENLGSKLAEYSQKPNYSIFDSIKLPKVVLRPKEGKDAQLKTLGSSFIDRR